jgi:hypothetical protein
MEFRQIAEKSSEEKKLFKSACLSRLSKDTALPRFHAMMAPCQSQLREIFRLVPLVHSARSKPLPAISDPVQKCAPAWMACVDSVGCAKVKTNPLTHLDAWM